jgi:hypothetical protein
MTFATGTIIVMAVCAGVAIIWDIIAVFGNDVPNSEDSISGINMVWGIKFWMLPYTLGVLGGHLFMPGYFLERVSWYGLLILVSVGVGLGTFSLLYGDRVSRKKWRISLRAFGLMNLGMIMGHLFWPQ